MFHTVKKLIQSSGFSTWFFSVLRKGVPDVFCMLHVLLLHMGAMPGGRVQQACKLKEHPWGFSFKEIWSSYKGGKILFRPENFLLNFSVARSHSTFWIQVLSLLSLFQDAYLYNICPWRTLLTLSPSEVLRHKYWRGSLFPVWLFKQQVIVLGTVEEPHDPYVCR